MDNSLKKVTEADRKINEIFSEINDLTSADFKHKGYVRRLKTVHLKWLYIGAMAGFIISGFFATLDMSYMLGRTILWIGLAVIVLCDIFLVRLGYLGDKKRLAAEVEHTKAEWEEIRQPFLKRIATDKDIEVISERYRYPIASGYLLDSLTKGSARSMSDAENLYEKYLEMLKEPGNREEYNDYIEQYDMMTALYPQYTRQEIKKK